MSDGRDERSNVERFYTASYRQAWALFDEGRDDECFALCHQLLMAPTLGDLYAAGFHCLLTYSSNQKLVHAERYVHLLEKMYDAFDPPPSTQERRKQEELVNDAKERLEEVRKELRSVKPYTDADIDRDCAILAANLDQIEREREQMEGQQQFEDEMDLDVPPTGARGQRDPIHRMRALSIDQAPAGTSGSHSQQRPMHRRVSSLQESIANPSGSQTPPTSQSQQASSRSTSSASKPAYDNRRTPSNE